MRLAEEEEIEEMERLEESKEVEVELLHQDSRWESSKTSNRREKNTTSLAGKYGRVQNKDRKHRAPKILKYGLLVGWGDEDRGAKKLSLETTSKLLEEDQGSRLLGEHVETRIPSRGPLTAKYDVDYHEIPAPPCEEKCKEGFTKVNEDDIRCNHRTCNDFLNSYQCIRHF